MTTTENSPVSEGGASFSKACRLRNPAEFKNVYENGTRKTSRSFVAFVLPNDGELIRFGLTTPRKLGKAHERNRIKRRVREIVRREYGCFPKGRDIVLNPRRSILDRDWYALRIELLSLLQTKA